uniref:Gamma carbonic anhydrase n=1 Tax=Fibrocapsa japonica TaxID=94617 RepID=A0A7S2V1B4_9STRA|mmetsp:Transcript_20644/g.29868  ORF Transcript_20644/g.29868 Transcript_20644/m.29868 type:complete len:260 (+) Transcript_20644:78-857(+)|eukprot:CAMPEP_0113943836 /NCGR_PEP_ID=MMETSP1339-20121228/28463_1 /TAXON_ID=94617 /ORGANISM="Fibrocapsa japonica" /LENGTH=259 /DNA_ID=CAMNT_0000948803 /DNA_START=74 /DNA_END=853 /DNA_ORIENTATION=+ /assembly_acc=CAM_ASM_000762
MIKAIGSVFSQAGRALEKAGSSLELNNYCEKLVLSTTNLALANKAPKSVGPAYVAATASIVGDVEVGAGTSVWYGVTVRGDLNKAKIGQQCSLGDNCTVHVDGKYPTTIGNRVIVGPGAMLHGCTIGEECVVGAGATVLDGATLEPGAVLAPGSVLGAGKTLPAGELWAGVPAKSVRNLSGPEREGIVATAAGQEQMAGLYAHEMSKGWFEILDDEDRDWSRRMRDPDDEIDFKPEDPDLVDGQVPGRIFDNKLNTGKV